MWCDFGWWRQHFLWAKSALFGIKPVKIVYITNLSMESERKIVGKCLTPHFDHNKCPFQKNDTWLHDMQIFFACVSTFCDSLKNYGQKIHKNRYDVIIWRQMIEISPNSQEMFVLSISNCCPNMKSFKQLSGKNCIF